MRRAGGVGLPKENPTLEVARALVFQMGVQKNLLGETISIATYLINMLHPKILDF